MDENKDPEKIVDPATNDDQQGNKDPEDNQKPSQNDPNESKDSKEQKPFSKRERLQHAKDKIDQQLQELDNEEDDTRPLTVGEFKKMQREESRKTAIDLASSIDDEDERTQVIDLLKDRITPSGDPEKDLELARGAVNSIKNAQIAQDLNRKTDPSQHSSTPGGPSKPDEAFQATDEEIVFMRPPYNLSKEDVLAARNKAHSNQ